MENLHHKGSDEECDLEEDELHVKRQMSQDPPLDEELEVSLVDLPSSSWAPVEQESSLSIMENLHHRGSDEECDLEEDELHVKRQMSQDPPLDEELEVSLVDLPSSSWAPVEQESSLSIMENLHHRGSDEESDLEDDELRMKRQLLQDTPLDEEEGDVSFADLPSSSWTLVDEAETVNNSEGVALLPYEFHRYEWTALPAPAIEPSSRREQFNSKTGPTIPVSDPYEIFKMIWDTEIMEIIVNETNIYAQQLAREKMDKNDLGPSSRITEWNDTNIDEMFVYFALVLAMGVLVKTKLQDYWCTDNNIFITPGFKVYMTLRRFQAISSCIHFNNNKLMQRQNLSASEAKLFKIQPILNHLNNRFSTMYNLSQDISLDESLLQWKGWLNIKQYIPNKAAKVGIKMYAVCESHTGYLWRFKIQTYSNSNPVNPSDPMSFPISALVLNLLQGLEFKGHTVWMDNYYNSPALARKLKSIGFDCAGTLRTNRQFVPPEITNLTKNDLKPGQIAGLTSGDIDILVWRDKNRVATISTYHGNLVSKNGKPNVVEDYNVCMGGVDKKDQLLSAYPVERKRTKVWYKKLFRHLLNTSVVNAYVIHHRSSRSKLEHRYFREMLIKSILKNHHNRPPQLKRSRSGSPIPPPPPPRPPNPLASLWDVRIHTPMLNDFKVTKEGTHSARARKTCAVCRKRVNTYCRGCNKACCLGVCFAKLHD